MCAINGVYKFNEDFKSSSIVRSMCKTMSYRGPDDMDFFEDDVVCLGQDRLSIIGVSNGHQPIFNEDRTLVIICNGEIYNYKELKEKLIENGHHFITDSDTEVILHSFEEKKEKCLLDFRGMFAFAVYNTKTKELFLARDINGKKPLYYSVTPKGFVFSSELLAIRDYYLNDFDLSWKELGNYLKFSFGQSMSETYIKQIKKVENASYITINKSSISNKRYWKKTNVVTYEGSYKDAKNECLKLLRESVSLRLRSDVPVAILLSSGVDSSFIAALAAESGNKVHAITAGYKGKTDCDEREIAKKFAKEKGLIWHEVELDENDFESYFYEYLKYIDEPVSDLASIAKWGIYKKAKHLGFKVLLSGDGSDEIFFGYNSHNDKAEILSLLYDYPKVKGETYKQEFLTNHQDIISRFFEGKDFLHHYRTFYYKGFETLKTEFENKDFDFETDSPVYKFYENESLAIEKIYSYLFNIWLPNNCYYLADKLAMGNSIESRCPFADKNLIEFMSSLPLDYKFKDNKPKGFLKDIAKDILPDYILSPAKRGFTPPNTIFKNLIDHYSNRYFSKKLETYNQLVVDYFLGEKLGLKNG